MLWLLFVYLNLPYKNSESEHLTAAWSCKSIKVKKLVWRTEYFEGK